MIFGQPPVFVNTGESHVLNVCDIVTVRFVSENVMYEQGVSHHAPS
jgi:hypothetical protein